MPSARRVYRFAQAIHRRQQDLLIALDCVHDRHNISAILRTADAVGVSRVIWQPDIEQEVKPNPEVAQGAERWVELLTVDNLALTIADLKNKGFQVVITHLGSDAIDFRKIDWKIPSVIVLGNERRGINDGLLPIADFNIFLPMMGLIQSLNVSVAAAIILYEIQRQRQEAGLYSRKLPKETVEYYFEKWDLKNEGFTLEELLDPPKEGEPLPKSNHLDGRNIFAGKLREKHRQKMELSAK